MKNIFIIGSKGIPAQYGGFETFVENLTAGQKSPEIKYHVSCFSDNNNEFEHNGARCFNIKVPNIGSGRAVIYDLLSLKETVRYIKKNNIKDPIVYVLACRIGPFIKRYKDMIHDMGGTLIVNPDGHEWKRAKWNSLIKKYWKVSEKGMIKNSDLIICDSVNIENYIHDQYNSYNTKFIAYGADIESSVEDKNDDKLMSWYKEKEINKNEYYLVVGRFVPENNYETIIKEFIKSKTRKNLVIITNVKKNKFYNQLEQETHFTNDKRIKFVGTVYDSGLLRSIRKNAYGYIHGHEVGGTNPSLLESLATTKLNIALDVGFNREVVKVGGLYFKKTDGSLTRMLDKLENADENFIDNLGELAKSRIRNYYNWSNIINEYEELLMNCSANSSYNEDKDAEMIKQVSLQNS